ncbi:M14 metallopeptidase family protein [Croceiramulus getboli]|nr:M14 family metallopeptidase [Flavobacteriaceae bacterium YJPT1-3]
MYRTLFLLPLLLVSFLLTAQTVQKPAEFLGYEIGAQFSRHADVVGYFTHVAENSEWVTYQEYGKTNERRPLTYAIVTSPQNHAALETLRKNHLGQIGILEGAFAKADKAVVWLSYNVHGNEASSTEAAMNTLYKLITEKQDWLQNTIVIMDPCINPDGRDRYANWYNQVKATPYDVDPQAAEHNEPWPGGRPNHYLFDLNRDWAWASQVESQQRLKIYNQWLPHVHVDFHEQGINEPYYFAPAAEPFHEVITDFQRDFQTEIGQNHARYFDQEGWLFFTKERFDLLYPSYGDTYPTFLGAIGMTYEQAGHGRAGLGIRTDEGYILTLKDRVAHHTTTGLSTVEVASRNVDRLNTEFQKFYSNTNSKYKSFVLTGNQDNMDALTELLDRHQIKYGYTGKGKTSGYRYTDKASNALSYDQALVVSTNQPKGTMVKVLFEPDAQLSNPLTYDITAWSLPHAFGLDAVASSSLVSAKSAPSKMGLQNSPNPSGAGYLSKWDSMDDARFLAALLKADIKVRMTERPLTSNGQSFERGSLIITKSDNRSREDFDQMVMDIANKHQRKLTVAQTSFSTAGPDFGSPDIKLINAPSIAMLKGDYVSSLGYGATWHYLEQQLHYPVTSIDTDDFKRTDLSKYNILIMPNGYYGGYLDETAMQKVTEFLRRGGKVIAVDNALSAFSGKDGFGLTPNENAPDDKTKTKENEDLIPYAEREKDNVKNLITGSIFKTQLDNTHPLAFGYGGTYYSLKLGSDSYAYLDNGFNVAYIKGDPQSVAGFAGADAKAKLSNSLVFGEQRVGRGSIIYMVDDPLFRAFWENGKLFFANALFMVNNDVARL